MPEYIKREAAIAYIREQSEECQKAFEELGGESGIYADAYNDLAEDFYSIPAADVAPVVHGRWFYKHRHRGGIRIYEGKDEMGETRRISVDERYEIDDPYCSECGKLNESVWLNYCPHCGAKMDGEPCTPSK